MKQKTNNSKVERKKLHIQLKLLKYNQLVNQLNKYLNRY